MTGPSDPSRPNPATPEPPTEPASTRGAHAQDPASELPEILDAYLADLEAGRSPDRARLIADHPHLAPSLEIALAGLEFIHRATPGGNQAPARLGDFRILREIGRGGMGVVYEAEQVSLKRRVALKVLRFGPIADPVAMQRFQREAETVGRLHHTNIVPIFAIGADDGVRYYAMQFIEGRDLGRVAQEMRNTPAPVDFRRIADWGLQAAEALAHAHRRGVIHRDIKPSNLILDADNRIWLTDFGLARRLDDVSLSLTGALLGTPRYMSPEQAAAAKTPVDHRTDLYSLGATLYELVTGCPIFEAASPHEVISQILHTDPPKPRTLSPNLHRDLETILLTCLAKEPRSRYVSAQALAEDLRAFVDGRPIAARRPRLLERTTRWVRQHRRLVTTAVLSATASVLVAAAGLVTWESYTAARLGRLQLSTSTAGALAEVLDGQGHPVVPLFPVPHDRPITLPAGSYQVRLSAPETLSETWPIEISARSQIRHTLDFTSRWLWPAQDFGVPQAVERVPLERGSGFLTLLPPESSPGTPSGPTRLRLIDARTAKPVWPADLAFDASSLPEGELTEWQHLLTHWAVAPNFAGTRIGERVTDLDRDGAGDFVLVSRSSASLLAVSGASGRVLWWHRSHPSLPPGTAKQGRWTTRPGQSFVVSYPDLADLDEDGIDDVVACFHATSESFLPPDGAAVTPENPSWIAVVSGRSGREIWRQNVDADWSSYASSSSGAHFDRLAHPTVVRVGTGFRVALPEKNRLRLWNGRTGEPAATSTSLGFELERAPRYYVTGNPPKPHALLARRYVDTEAHLELLAVDLESGSVRWRNIPLTVLGGVATELDAMPPETFQAVNLESDGASEIVALVARHPKPDRWTFGVQVIDAATGQPRWETSLHDAGHPQSIPSEARCLPGPDLDRDGSRDVVVLPSYDHVRRRHGLLVAALSGSDGTVLWRQHHPGFGGVRSLETWQTGADGWPLWVATTSPFEGGRPTTLVFEGGSGRIAHTLLDVRDVHIADLDGDGAPDLLHTSRTQNALRWIAIRGLPRPDWQRPGTWSIGPDADADGAPDFFGVSGSTFTARSGTHGRTLWTVNAEFAMPETVWTPSPARNASANAGLSFVLAAVNVTRSVDAQVRSTYRSFAAFSTRDGRRLWTTPELDLNGGERGGSSLGWAYEYPRVEFADLDGDGTPEWLASLVVEQNKVRLSVVSGLDGRVLWETPVVDGAMAPDPRPAGPPIADFDRDGIRDLALIVPPSATPTSPAEAQFRVEVRHGRDGRSLWPAPYLLGRHPGQIAWPEPTLGDLDGDGTPEVLVVRHSGYTEDRGYPCELVALDGRSGQVRWIWKWHAGFPAVWAPLVLDAPEPSGRRVALGMTALRPQPGISELGSFGFVVLDASGTLLFHRGIRGSSPSADRGGLAWSALDLDGDGASELLYPDEGFLCAGFGPNLLPRWRKALSGPNADPVRLVTDPNLRPETGAALVLWSGYDVFGIEGTRGDVAWRGRAPAAPVWGSFGSPHLRLVPSPSNPQRIRLHFAPPLARSDVTRLEQTWPTQPDGRFEPPFPSSR